MANALRQMRNRMSRRNTYDCADADPTFRVQALGLKGMKVASLSREVSDDTAAELASMWKERNPPVAVLIISADNGVRITDGEHNDIMWYDLKEIAYCNVHRDCDDVFVFTGQRNEEARCHAFMCAGPARANAICLAMSRAFQKSLQDWKRAEEIKRRSSKIEAEGKLSLLLDDAPMRNGGKFPSTLGSEDDLTFHKKVSDAKKSSVIDRFFRFSPSSKSQSEWSSIPSSDENEADCWQGM